MFGLLFFSIGLLCIRMGMLGQQAGLRHYNTLIASSAFMICFWAYRLMQGLLGSKIDPNPRAHLHLAVTFLVVGILLLVTGLKGRVQKRE